MKQEIIVKVRVVSTIIVILLLIVWIFATAIWTWFFLPKFHYQNFSDIQDFDALNSYILKDELSDSQIKTLTPEASYVHYVKYKGKVFKLFAYVFSDQEETYCYFENCTGQSPIVEELPTVELNHRFRSNIFHTSFITFQNCCAYRVEGGNSKSVVEFVEFVSSLFDSPQETDCVEELMPGG